jgi:hypothetical protein
MMMQQIGRDFLQLVIILVVYLGHSVPSAQYDDDLLAD